MKKILLITFTSLFLMAACQSNQKTEIGAAPVVDSSVQKVQSEIDKMNEKNIPR